MSHPCSPRAPSSFAGGAAVALLVVALLCRGASVGGAEPGAPAAERRFELVATASPETTSRIAAHATLCFDRYARLWPPRAEPARLPKILLCGTLDEYRAALAERGLRLANPACFLAAENLVLLGFDGAAAEADLQAGRERTARLSASLDRLRAEQARRVRDDEDRFRREGTPAATRTDLKRRRLQAFQQAENEARQALRRADEANRTAFDRAAERLLTTAAHELFHAYAVNYVYPAERGALPRWLDEGMAQVVEHAAWSDAGPRFDPPPAELIRRVRAVRSLKPADGGEAFDLRRLLEAPPEEFLFDGAAQAAGARTAAEHRYLGAWSLVQFLVGRGELKPGDALDRYVADRQAAPAVRFERFAGRPLKTVEAEWRAWLERL